MPERIKVECPCGATFEAEGSSYTWVQRGATLFEEAHQGHRLPEVTLPEVVPGLRGFCAGCDPTEAHRIGCPVADQLEEAERELQHPTCAVGECDNTGVERVTQVVPGVGQVTFWACGEHVPVEEPIIE